MAVLPMKSIYIYALQEDRKKIMDIIQRRGAVHINQNLEEDDHFQKLDISTEKSNLERQRAVVEEALDILESRRPEEKSMLDILKGKEEISLSAYKKLSESREDLLTAAYRLIELSKLIAEYKSDVYKLQSQIDTLTPWSRLDIPLKYQVTKSVAVLIGTLDGEKTREDIIMTLADQAPDLDAVDVEIINTTRDQTCIVLLCPKACESDLEGALRSLGFARPAITTQIPPAKQIEKVKAEKSALEQELSAAEREILVYLEKRNNLKFLADYLTILIDKYEAISNVLNTPWIFILSGYIPEREVKATLAALKGFDLYVEVNEPGDEDVPVLLENNKFAEPVEGVIRSFSFPSKGEIDPSAVMAGFYYILFGLMLSDAAYGLLMALGCGICLWKFKNMESSIRKTLRMFFFCGLSTLFWGAMFGSWFGDVVKVVSTTFFNKTVSIEPIWFEPISDPMKMLVFSMAVGLVHLFAGLGAKLYMYVKTKQYKDALYDVIFWYMLVGGLVIVLLASEKFTSILNINLKIPAVVGRSASIAAAVAAIGIVLTAGRESRSWFKRILKGIYGLYNVTGYMSDVLSYSRLLALGLATGVIATVINQMGAMGGSGIGGAILFIIVFIIGHAINIGINLLGAYVHTNRLTFVEFFGKFYEGGGSEFAPLAVNTQYFKIKEETE